jgi:hypothetical protein
MVERPLSPTLQSRIIESKLLSGRIGSLVNDIHFSANNRNRLAGACFDLALEHHNAVIVLIEARLGACAFALQRIIYEAHIRGLWLLHVAKANDIANYMELKSKPLDKMVREINCHANLAEAGYTKFQAYAKTILDDYVHCGYRAVSRRNSTDAIEEVHCEEQEIEALTFADLFSLMTVEQIVTMSGNQKLAATYHQEYVEFLSLKWPNLA